MGNFSRSSIPELADAHENSVCGVNLKYKCTLTLSMTIKSLTITEGAYETLKRIKHGDESFSDVILRIGTEKKNHLDKYVGILKMSNSEVAEVLQGIKKRRKEMDIEFTQKQERLKRIIQHGRT